MQKIVQVHMLPTKGGTGAQIYLEGNQFEMRTVGYGTPQHLYFTSEEEIKEGDWVLDIEADKKYTQCLRTGKDSYWNKNGRKIVATTNPELWGEKIGYSEKVLKTIGEQYNHTTQIFKIPLSFIKEYVEKQVKEVKLEYEVDIQTKPAIHDGQPVSEMTGIKEILKLDSQGCVIISAVQDTWSDVWTAYCKYRDTHPEIYVGQFLEWLKANYHPPVKK